MLILLCDTSTILMPVWRLLLLLFLLPAYTSRSPFAPSLSHLSSDFYSNVTSSVRTSLITLSKIANPVTKTTTHFLFAFLVLFPPLALITNILYFIYYCIYFFFNFLPHNTHSNKLLGLKLFFFSLASLPLGPKTISDI